MEFRILGPVEVANDGHVLALGSGRQLALVAVLLLHRNQVVSIDRLVDDLWDSGAPPTAAKIVRNNVSLLRKELGDRLETRPPGYVLRVEEGELDSERLERAIDGGDLSALTDALALWRGTPLSQFAYEPFAQTEVARLEELRLAAIESRIDGELALGRHAQLIPELEALVQRHPSRERLQGQLMLALYRSGRQADALEAYRRARRALHDELGIEPGTRLRELERSILNQDESLSAQDVRADDPTRRTLRPRPIVLVAAGVVLAAIAAALVVLTHNSSGGLSVVPPNHVGVIDPTRGQVVAAVPVGIRPGPVTAGVGSVWVGNVDDRSLTRVDPVRRTAAATVSLDRRTPTGLTVGAGSVWVAHGRSGELSRVEPRFGEIARVVITERPYAAPYGSVSFEGGLVWAAYGDSTLARIRASVSRVTGSTLTGGSAAGVVVGGNAVWVANAGAATVERFDPITFEQGPVRAVSVGRRPVALALGAGALWVANRADDTVTRIDPDTNASVFTVRVGDEPVAVAVGAGAVWVANAGDGSVSQIDPDSNEVVRTIDVGNPVAGIAVGAGVVWVTVQSP
jgi:YVTN family beta-propeller protein